MTTVITTPFGTSKQGVPTTLYTLDNGQTRVSITNYGATIVGLTTLDQKGFHCDVVLGFDHVEGYQAKGSSYFGAIIGRNSNRVRQGVLPLNKLDYQLEQNDGTNNLHAGSTGFHQHLFQVVETQSEHGQALECHLHSPHMEGGFPGNLQVMVRYSLTADHALIIEYFAKSDLDTVVNLTNHSYFNLNGHANGSILGHTVCIDADFYTPLATDFCPTGEIRSVHGTPYDFTTPHRIGDRLESLPDYALTGGYDHNFVLRTKEQQMTHAATVTGDQSGIQMDVYTNQAGMQFYTGNMIPAHLAGKNAATYEKHAGFCLETQCFPNAMQLPHFPSPILRAGMLYHYTTVYQFSL